MKKVLIFVLTVILTAFSLAGCESNESEKTVGEKETETISSNTAESQSSDTEDTETAYIYVKAFGDDWIFGDNTMIICGKDHGYKNFDTVRIEYYKDDCAEETGTVTVDQFGDLYEYTYGKIIKKVAFSRASDPYAGEPLFG